MLQRLALNINILQGRMKAELSTPRIFWDHGIDTDKRERSSSLSRDRRAKSEQKKKNVQVTIDGWSIFVDDFPP